MTVTDALPPVSPRPERTLTRAESTRQTRSFTELAQTVRGLGLNDRTPWFYGGLFAGLMVALLGALTGLVLLGDSWYQLLIAAALGIIFTQFAFLGHEASHRQVFAAGPANDRFGRVLANVFVGISYQWWMSKHTRHHGNPNKLGKDPDIVAGTFVSFTHEDAEESNGVHRWFTKRQGWLFFPLLLFVGLDLHQASIRSLFARGPVAGRGIELLMLAARFGVYFGLVFWVMPIGLAFAFLGVQFFVFGFYMGASFAPNHIGMPIVPANSRLNFLDKQVLTSRNVSGGWFMTALMGGLNYQIEHHLFPSMPRPHLWKARQLVQEHCAEHGVPYTETNLARALGIVVAHMNRVGLAAAREFRCPTAGVMGRR